MILIILLLVRQSHRSKIALSHLAHSIKSPVARLKLNTETLLEERVASEDEELAGIKAVGDEVNRLELAVRNAALSLEKGKRALKLEECSLAEIVLDTARVWQLTFDKTDIALKIDHLGATLDGKFDPGLIAIMIDNLIDNGLHYTRLNKKNLPRNTAAVTVEMTKDERRGIITIDDTGKGIPKAERSKIFKRFYRGKDPVLASVSGIGLGLVLVREIAKAHGGKIRVEDNPQGGARFVIELPIRE